MGPQVSTVLWMIAIAVPYLLFWIYGRKSAKRDAELDRIRQDLITTNKAREIENEVQALSVSDLERRASQWVRGPGN